MDFKVINKYIVFIAVITFLSCDSKKYHLENSCNDLVSRSVGFNIYEIHTLNTMVEECATSKQELFGNHLIFSQKVNTFSKDRILNLNYRDIHLDIVKVNEELTSFIRNFIKSEGQHLKIEDLKMLNGLIEEVQGEYCTVGLSKLFVSSKARDFVHFLAIECCRLENNMHIYRPPITKISGED